MICSHFNYIGLIRPTRFYAQLAGGGANKQPLNEYKNEDFEIDKRKSKRERIHQAKDMTKVCLK